METYLTLLYVTVEQELALKDFFTGNGWRYCKPDLSVFTDRVGPVENPHCFRTKTAGIINYSKLSGNNESVKTKTAKVKEVTKKGTKKGLPSPDVTDIKVEVLAEHELASDLDGFEKEVIEEQTENDDGDNDDDFADDFAVNEEENDTEDTDFPKNIRKRSSRKSPVKKEVENSQGTSSLDREECLASGRKRRKVAAMAEAKIEAVLSEEKEETDLKPVLLVPNRGAEKRPPPGVKKKCSMCPREFSFQFNLDRHCKLVHDPNNPPKPKVKKKPRTGVHQCDICGSVFKRSDNLLDHKRIIHEGAQRRQSKEVSTCDVCGATFKRGAHLKEHVLVKHSNSKLPHGCHLCEKSFIRTKYLQVHINRDHLKIKPYGCQFCKKMFHSEFSAKNHMKKKICRPDRVKKFKCIHCEEKFPNARQLEMHMTAKHYGGAYTCVCGEVVGWSSSVTKHKRRCKTYKEYEAENGQVTDKLCNVVEVLYSDVVVENTEENDPVIPDRIDVPKEVGNTIEMPASIFCQDDIEETVQQSTI